jgi:hypothetical protein
MNHRDTEDTEKNKTEKTMKNEERRIENEEWRRKGQRGQVTFPPPPVMLHSSFFVFHSSFLCLVLLCVLGVSVVPCFRTL